MSQEHSSTISGADRLIAHHWIHAQADGWDAALGRHYARRLSAAHAGRLLDGELCDLGTGLELVGWLLSLPELPSASAAQLAPEETRLLDRVRALLAKAESTEFPDEAEALTAKAQDLVSRHSLQQMLRAGAGLERPGVWHCPIDDPYAEAKWLLLSVLARANRCQAVYVSELGFSTVLGFDTDLRATEVLFASLLVQATRALAFAGTSADTWLAVDGGMGTVTTALADAGRRAGAEIRTGAPVAHASGTGVALADGTTLDARAVVAAVDPYRLQTLTGIDPDPRWAALPGMTMKLNLALSEPLDWGVPLPGAGTTVHLLPEPIDGSWTAALRAAYDTARAGLLPDQPAIEVYAAPHLATGVFVQGVPSQPVGSSWAATRDAYTDRILDLVETAAPGLRDRLRGVDALTPADIEARFGITGGHIFHVDNSLATVDRLPLRPGPEGLYVGAAGCHPAGSVIGAAGWIAAGAVLADLTVASG